MEKKLVVSVEELTEGLLQARTRMGPLRFGEQGKNQEETAE